MKDRTETLRMRDRAPEFNLATANSAGGLKVGDTVSLSGVIVRGPLIVEFLRGTW